MSYKIDTQTKGLYVISDDHITRHFFSKEEDSAGLIVKSHQEPIRKALFCAWLIREGKCYESIEAYWHEEDDLKNAPLLEKVVPVLEQK